jgi:phospholipid/cholesterol/gamma-HCH transport system ATP-binding protein
MTLRAVMIKQFAAAAAAAAAAAMDDSLPGHRAPDLRYTGAMATEPVVDISDLAFSYPARKIFSAVNLTIPRGQVTGIMGGSGSGKSTLLRLIGGQLRPTSGVCRVMGQDVHALGHEALYELRRKIGMQFQQNGLFTDLSVFDNLAFPMREKTDLTESQIEDLVKLKLNAVGLRGAAHLMPSELSGGMIRRVGLARAIALDPALIMYDEPFAGLDPISCSVVGNLIRKLNDALGVTSIVVSYDATEALKIIDYVYFLADGVVAAEGTTAEVKASTDPFVHQFIRGEPDGPVPFHYPAAAYAEDMDMSARA